jgi:acetyltransferase-like isoleucine patch superfamily enzyme
MYINSYNPLAWVRGLEKGNVSIGEKCWIGPFCVIDGEYDKVTLGKGVNVSSGAQIVTHDTVMRCITGGKYQSIDHAPTIIGDYVYIGTNAVILKGCIIGSHSIIAAGAVVLENTIIPSYSLVVGVPAIIKANIQNKIEHYGI